MSGQPFTIISYRLNDMAIVSRPRDLTSQTSVQFSRYGGLMGRVHSRIGLCDREF